MCFVFALPWKQVNATDFYFMIFILLFCFAVCFFHRDASLSSIPIPIPILIFRLFKIIIIIARNFDPFYKNEHWRSINQISVLRNQYFQGEKSAVKLFCYFNHCERPWDFSYRNQINSLYFFTGRNELANEKTGYCENRKKGVSIVSKTYKYERHVMKLLKTVCDEWRNRLSLGWFNTYACMVCMN